MLKLLSSSGDGGGGGLHLEMWLVKLIAGAILFVLSISFGLSPLFCLRRFIVNPAAGKAKAALGFASCIAAGVFLAVCLLDLLPDVQEALSKGLTSLNVVISFPMAELVMAMGLFFILSIEMIVSLCNPDLTEMMHSHGGGGDGHGHGHSHSHSHSHPPQHHQHPVDTANSSRQDYEELVEDEEVPQGEASATPTPNTPGPINNGDDSGPPGTETGGGNTGDDDDGLVFLIANNKRRRRNSSEREERAGLVLGGSRSSPALPVIHSTAAFDTASVVMVHRTPSIQSLPAIYLHQHQTLREVTAEAGLSAFDRPFRAIILLIALSIHSLFEGLSIGAAQNQDVVVQLTLALAIHKPLESLGVCLSLIRSSKTQSFVVKLVIFFSITCPLGVGIGAGVLGLLTSGTSGISDLVTGVLQGLAGGSFLYVVFIEVLPHEFVDVLEEPQAKHPQDQDQASSQETGGGGRAMTPRTARNEMKRIRTLKMFKLLGLLLGFTLITATKLFLPEDEDGPHPC